MRGLKVLPVVLFCGVFACGGCASAPPGPAAMRAVVLHGHRFHVAMALTPGEQAHGLMDRRSLPRDEGMLFVFPDATPRTFWMKNTLIPLDMLFFDDDRRLVSVQANAQPCRADPCRLYPSETPARYVLELNAGTAAKLGLRKGDVITFSGSSSGTQ